MKSLNDFLSFKSFISIEVLIFFYYLGAIFLPFILALFFYKSKAFSLSKKFLDKTQRKIYFILAFIISFILAEIFWRIGFEAIIGYFQMIQAIKSNTRSF
jgi:hypothetical protein